MSVRDRYNYDLYFVPEFPIERFDRYHRDPERELLRFVESVTAHIEKFGLQNPPCVQRRNGQFDVRPGKCRVTAYVRLGRTHMPVLLVDYDQIGPDFGWQKLPYDLDEVQKLFSGDCIVEMSRRFCNVKKNVDVVHRPGRINQFEREVAETE